MKLKEMVDSQIKEKSKLLVRDILPMRVFSYVRGKIWVDFQI